MKGGEEERKECEGRKEGRRSMKQEGGWGRKEGRAEREVKEGRMMNEGRKEGW